MDGSNQIDIVDVVIYSAAKLKGLPASVISVAVSVLKMYTGHTV